MIPRAKAGSSKHWRLSPVSFLSCLTVCTVRRTDKNHRRMGSVLTRYACTCVKSMKKIRDQAVAEKHVRGLTGSLALKVHPVGLLWINCFLPYNLLATTAAITPQEPSSAMTVGTTCSALSCNVSWSWCLRSRTLGSVIGDVVKMEQLVWRFDRLVRVSDQWFFTVFYAKFGGLLLYTEFSDV